MNLVNLKIGDEIEYYAPPEWIVDKTIFSGKITKIYTDSVVINNNIHISEKYIIKKIENKNMIKVEELKIGDRVKFANFVYDYSDDKGTIKYFINKNKVRLIHLSGEIEIDTNLIISKLEPIPQEIKYKEILIEKENLKDLHTYICPQCHKFLNKKIKVVTGPYTGKTGTVTALWYNGDSCSGNFAQYLISIDNKYDYNNSFGINIKDCEVLEDNLSAPKSFKFDISFVNRLEFNQSPFTPDSFGDCFFKIEGCKITYHPDNPKNFPEAFNGKEYTIEIKEKE